MREKMEINVTRKEDIGRIKSYQIVEWNPDEPMLPEVKPMFAYMPHRGTEYKVPAPQLLGSLLAHSLRQTMREAAKLHNMTNAHTMSTLHLVNRLVKTLQVYSDVLENSGLNPEEMQEAEGYAELYNVLTEGAAGRKALLEHATGQNSS